MDSKKLALLCRELADEKKAEDLVVINVSDVSSVTDYFVICSGTSEPHVRAIKSEIEDGLLEDHNIRARAIDGDGSSPWQVLDFFDVIVHVMRKDIRAKYDIEGLWGDAPRVKTRKKAAPKTAKTAKAAKTAESAKTAAEA